MGMIVWQTICSCLQATGLLWFISHFPIFYDRYNMYSIKRFFEITIVLIAKDFKIKYKNTLLGYIWAMGYPLAFASILYIAFKNIIRIKVDNYGLFLMVGIFPWQWFANATYLSSRSLITNATLIKKILFPRSLLPLSTVLIEMIHFILSWIVIIFFLFLNDQRLFYLSWLYGAPLITIIQLAMIYGVGLAVSSLNIFFRDMERIVSLLTTMLFYMTPVIFPLTLVPESYKPYFLLNPMTGLIELWRTLFLEGVIAWGWLALSAVYASLFLLVGGLVFRSLKNRFAEVL